MAGPGKRGRKPYKPTDEQRQNVGALCSYGVPEADVAKYLGIDPKTLRKYFRNELDRASIAANGRVAGALFKSAMDGNTTAQIFWLKTRARWSEAREVERIDLKVETLSDEERAQRVQELLDKARDRMPSGRALARADAASSDDEDGE